MCSVVFIGFTSILQAQIVGIQTRAFSSPPDFQMWAEISTDGQLFSTGLLYGDGTPNTFTGGLWGLTILGDEYFATEFVDGAGDDCRLVKIVENGLVTQAQRVGTASIGFPAVECLAASGSEIFGMSVNYGSHRSSLISISPDSGLGTMLGPGDFDVIIVGLAFHPVLGKLFGAGIPFGSVQEHNLYEINIENGSTTLIGALGAEIHGLAYHNELGLIGVFQKLYSIDTNTGNASVVNEEANFSHDGNPSNGLYTLAAHSGGPPHAFPPFHILSVSLIDESAILPTSETWPVPSIMRFDEDGEFLYAAYMDNGGNAFDQELTGDRDDTSRFFAGYLNQDAQAVMAVYNGISLTPDYAHAVSLITTQQKSGISFFPGKIAGLLQDAGTYIRLLTLSPSGDVSISQDYSSSDLLGPDIPGFASQTAKISQVPDGSGFYISVQWSQLDITNSFNLGRKNRFILLKTDNAGGLVWARKFDLTSGVSPLIDISAPVDGNGYLYRLTDVEIAGQNPKTHTKVIRINSDGTLGFATRIEDVRLSSVVPTQEEGILYLGGSYSSPTNPLAADSVFIAMNSQTGVIINTLVLNQGPFDTGSYSGVTESWVFLQNISFSGDPSNTDAANIDLIRVAKDFSNPMSVRYQGTSSFGALTVRSDNELLFSAFNNGDGSVGAFALNGDFVPLVSGCAQFPATDLTTVTRELTVTPLEVVISESTFSTSSVDNLFISADLPVAELSFTDQPCGDENPPVETVSLAIALTEDRQAVNISFPTVTGINYDIKRTNALTGEFVSLQVLAGTGDTAEFQDSLNSSQAYYQVTASAGQ